MTGFAAPRTPNERALDQQHEIVRRLEAVIEWYAEMGVSDRVPCQRVRGLLKLEQQRRDALRRRVQRERARPGS